MPVILKDFGKKLKIVLKFLKLKKQLQRLIGIE